MRERELGESSLSVRSVRKENSKIIAYAYSMKTQEMKFPSQEMFIEGEGAPEQGP